MSKSTTITDISKSYRRAINSMKRPYRVVVGPAKIKSQITPPGKYTKPPSTPSVAVDVRYK